MSATEMASIVEENTYNMTSLRFRYKWDLTSSGLSNISSPIFLTKSDYILQWQLKVDTAYHSQRLFLRLLSCDDRNLEVSVKCAIFKDDAVKFIICSMHTSYDVKSELPIEHTAEFIKNISLGRNSPVDPSERPIAIALITIKQLQKNDGLSQISRDLKLILENSKFSDVTLTLGEKEFKTHRVILAARSPVFSALFEYDKRDVIPIEEDTPETFKELLSFIYSEKVENLKENAANLLVLAEKYAIDDLKSLCEIAIQKNLNVDNAADVLVLADRQNAKNLKVKTTAYIFENKDEVIKTSGYENMKESNINLIAELFEKTPTKKRKRE